MKASDLIDDLVSRTEEVIAEVNALKGLSDSELNWRAAENSWSILECLEHLNLYGDFYIPAMRESILNCTTKSDEFKSGWLGDYFAKSMLPRPKLNKMKTFKSKNPIHSSLNRDVISRFMDQQEQIVGLLKDARSVNLSKAKCPTTIGNWVKINLGDTFRVVIYHNQRHMRQIDRVKSTFISV